MSDEIERDWQAVPNEDGDPRIIDIQTAGGWDCVAHVYGDSDAVRQARASQIVASGKLLAYAECQEAWDRFQARETTFGEFSTALMRHGIDDVRDLDLASLRRAALAAVRGTEPKEG